MLWGMSDKQKEAARKRWSKVPQKKRSKMMSQAAQKRWDNTPAPKRRRIALKMVKARTLKKNGDI